MNNIIHKFLESTIGRVFGKDITCREPVHRCDDYQPGSLVELGRTTIKFFKKILMPCGLCAAVPVIKPANSPQENMSSYCKEPEVKKLIRPSDLPIYTFEDDYSKQIPCVDCPPSVLEQNISNVRKGVQTVVVGYQNYVGNVTDIINIGIEHSKTLLDYLRDESNVIPRMGAVGIGGLTGLMLGLRKRRFKRIVYSTTGALTMGAICYPKEAEEGFNMAKHYANISYNFIRGVKPGDERQLENIIPELPNWKIPTSFSEFVDLTIVTGSAVATAISSFAQYTYTTLSSNKEEKQSKAKLDTKQD